MRPRPPIFTRTDTRLPYTTLFRSASAFHDFCKYDERLVIKGWLLVHRVVPFLQQRKTYSILKRLMVNRSEEHTSELQSLMRISYAVFCSKKKQRFHNDYNSTRHPTTSHTASISNPHETVQSN